MYPPTCACHWRAPTKMPSPPSPPDGVRQLAAALGLRRLAAAHPSEIERRTQNAERRTENQRAPQPTMRMALRLAPAPPPSLESRKQKAEAEMRNNKPP